MRHAFRMGMYLMAGWLSIAGVALAATPRYPATDIPLKGPYRYDRGWYHKVDMGDTLPGLANRFGVDLRYLAKVNGLQINSFLVLNSYLYIPPHSGYYHRVQAGETLVSIASRFHLDLQYLAATNRIYTTTKLRTGETLIIPTRVRPAPIPEQPKRTSTSSYGSSGATSSRSTTKSPTSTYSSSPQSRTSPSPSRSSVAGMTHLETKKISVPRPTVTTQSPPQSKSTTTSRPSSSSSSSSSSSGGGAAARSPRRSSDGRPTFQWPIEGTVMRGYVNSEEKKHRGVDIAAPEGTPIRAAADGVVIYSGDDIPGYGRMVIVDHGRGWASCYAHNSANKVKKDQRVSAGKVVALAGESGRATGPHCHFEIRHDYEAIDPMPLLP